MEHLAFWIPVSLAALLVWLKRDRAIEDVRFVVAVVRGRRPEAPPRPGAVGTLAGTSGFAHGEPYAAWTASVVVTDSGAERERGGVSPG